VRVPAQVSIDETVSAMMGTHQPQCPGVLTQRCFRSIVGTLTYHGNIASHASNLKNDSFTSDEKPGKDLAHLHDCKHVDFEDLSDFGDVDIRGWRSIVGAGVVDKIVEAATSDQLNLFLQSENGTLFLHIQSKRCDISMRLAKVLQVGLGACSSDDFETSAGKLEGKSSTDSTAAPGDEHCLHLVVT